MASKHTIKEAWEQDDKVFMKLYGLDLDHPESGLPRFGSDIRMDALRDARVEAFRGVMGTVGNTTPTQGKKIRETSTLPTILNLAWYFRYISVDGGLEVLRPVAEQDPATAANITHLILKSSEDKFFHERVEPLRDYLEWKWQIYLYCIPSAIYETQLVGGKSWRLDGPAALCFLPKFPQVALDRGEQEAKLYQLAGQVIWLVRSRLCINCKNSEKKQDLVNVIDSWKRYVSGYYLLEELEKMARNNPFVFTEQVQNALVPPSVLDLLRLPAGGA
jgi:hypothetical protein